MAEETRGGSRVTRLTSSGRPRQEANPSAGRQPGIETFASIKVIGIGGGGGNAVDRMIRSNIAGLEFIAVNTDAQALMRSLAPTRIRIGDKVTKGLGSGGDANLGHKAAEENIEDISEALSGADMVFIAACMGGGTGTGGAPIIADIANELGALAVGVVTKPFEFEGASRTKAAEEGLEELHSRVDTLITIPNDKILQIADKKMPITDAFRLADDVLRQAIQGISDLITQPGLINLDFNDVRTIMTQAGTALMALGESSSENRAVDAVEAALNSPLLDISIDGAKGVLLNFTGGLDLSLFEINEAASIVANAADPEANIIFGAVIDESLGSEIRATVIATGFGGLGGESAGRRRSTGFGRARQLGLESPREGTRPEVDIPAFLRRRTSRGSKE